MADAAPSDQQVTVKVEGGDLAPAAELERRSDNEPTAPTTSMIANVGTTGGNSNEDGTAATPAIQVDREELKRKARQHMIETACTQEKDGERVWLSVFTPPKELGWLGVGVQLYFDFIFWMGVIFFIMSILTGPNLAAFVLGSMVEEEGALGKYTGMVSIANLGNCPETGCESHKQLEERCAYGNDVADCIKVRDVTPIMGILDAAASLLFVLFAVWFAKRWIPWRVEQTDKANCTPSDYAVMIKSCPRVFGNHHESEEHAQFEDKVREHFKSVLTTGKNAISEQEAADAVQEVVLAREYDGMIARFMQYGCHLEEQKEAELLRDQALANQKHRHQKRHSKTVESYEKKIQTMREQLAHQSKLKDEHRHVVMIFIMFKREQFKAQVLDEYRFARYWLFRCCQSQRLRLEGHNIAVEQACEPNDLYWENIDYSKTWRMIRKAIILLLTIIVLIACSLAIVLLKTANGVTDASPPSVASWIIVPDMIGDGGNGAAQHAECFELCKPEFFSSPDCKAFEGSSDSWTANKWFTTTNETSLSGFQSLGSYFGTTCANPIRSPACDGETDPTKNFIGFQFADPRVVQCTTIDQGSGGIVSQLRVYACKDVPEDVEASGWGVDQCQAMEAVNPSTTANAAGVAASGKLRLALDTYCNARPAADEDKITLQAAEAAVADAKAAGDTIISSPTYSCFCQQQAFEKGAGFFTPPYDQTPEKALCEEWGKENVAQNGRLVGAILAVVVLNQVLLVLYTFFIAWERLMTVSEVTKSQLSKLFASQFVNTGLLVLLVNAKIQSVPDILQFISVLSIGKGNYYDLNSEWFTAVGSSLIITILMQVFSTTIPPLVMSWVVAPLQIRFAARGKMTQETMNRAFTLPEWNLSLRLAQSMNVIFCVVMYSSGMPVVYTIGWIYCFVAYWLDKVALLWGSKRPPNYTEDVLYTCMHLMPVAVFLHVALAAWTFGNQMLFPSNWNDILVPFGEMLFGITTEEYDTVVTDYRISNDSALYWDFIAARFLDMARDGTAILMVAFLVFCALYIIFYLYTMGLKPILDPVLFLLKECCCGCACCKSAQQHEELAYPEAVKEMQSKGLLVSYSMQANEKYKAAALAIKHSAEQARDETARAKAKVEPTSDAVEPTSDANPQAVASLAAAPEGAAGLASAVTDEHPAAVQEAAM